jgi:TonB family protein
LAANCKATIPVFGLAAALLGGCAQAPGQQGNTLASAPTGKNSVCAKPVWPRADLLANHQGTVTLSFLIGPEGDVLETKVLRSSGYPGLDEAARAGLSKCHFRPGMVNGKPQSAWMQIQYRWVGEP